MNDRGLLRRTVIFLSVLGPSVVATMAGNDGAGIITYSLAGARLGYAVLLTLPILTVLYAVTQEMGSRVAIVTGKGLGDIIRERFGVRIAILVFAAIVAANFGTLLTNVAALKTASQMLGLPAVPFIVIVIVFCFALVTFTKYEKSQKIFLTGIVFYLAYVFSAVVSHPDWGHAVRSLFVPPETLWSKEYLIVSIAVLGTTITPWGQFFVQSYMKDKNVSVERLGYAKVEAYLGAFISDFFTFFIIVATAATLFLHKIPLNSGDNAALAIRPFAGELAVTLFAVGLVNAAIIGITVVSLTSAYALTEFFGFRGSLDEPYKTGESFYITFLTTIVAATALVITPWFSVFKIVLYTQSLNGILLPLFFYFLLRIVNDGELMGEHVNSRLRNLFAIASTAFIVIAGVAAVTLSILGA